MKPLCPELRAKPYSIGLCDLSDHYCDKEIDPSIACPTYDQYLDDLYQEWLAEHSSSDQDLYGDD